MEFDTIKCNVVRFGESKNRLYQCKLGDVVLNRVNWEKDLGIIINMNLHQNYHIKEKVHRILGLLTTLKRVFVYMDEGCSPHKTYSRMQWYGFHTK